MRATFAMWTVSALSLAGCGAEVGAPQPSEEIAVAEQPLVVGNWQGYYWNGSAGSDFFDAGPPAHVICAVTDPIDGWSHPGKLWNGQCRYEWGGTATFSSGYDVLKKPINGVYYWAPFPGYKPADAVVSWGPSEQQQLAVCLAWYGGQYNVGKEWMGQCLFEWGNFAHSVNSFQILKWGWRP